MTDLAIGLMSGTSLDGIDAALVRFDGSHDVELVAYQNVPFTDPVRAAILDVISRGTTRSVARLHVDLGHWLADAAQALLEREDTPADALAFCASHGLTVWHEPRRATLQVGDPAVLAERLGVRIVSDFRSRDVAAGGEGAPLVPLADAMLFGHPQHARVLLNVGGMANVTLVPQLGSCDGLVAFDTGPGIAVCDAIVRMETGHAFDRDGQLAASGSASEEVANELLEDSYFATPPPKSTGRERFADQFAARLIERVRARKPQATTGDCAATSLLVSCRAVARAVSQWLPGPVEELVISGGGARNPVLVSLLRRELGDTRLSLFDELFFDGDAKEAVAFAYLGWLTIHGEPGNVPSVTGARGRRVLGHMTPP